MAGVELDLVGAELPGGAADQVDQLVLVGGDRCPAHALAADEGDEHLVVAVDVDVLDVGDCPTGRRARRARRRAPSRHRARPGGRGPTAAAGRRAHACLVETGELAVDLGDRRRPSRRRPTSASRRLERLLDLAGDALADGVGDRTHERAELVDRQLAERRDRSVDVAARAVIRRPPRRSAQLLRSVVASVDRLDDRARRAPPPPWRADCATPRLPTVQPPATSAAPAASSGSTPNSSAPSAAAISADRYGAPPISTTPTWRHDAAQHVERLDRPVDTRHRRRRRHDRLAHEQQRQLRRQRPRGAIELDASAVGDGDDVGRRRQQRRRTRAPPRRPRCAPAPPESVRPTTAQARRQLLGVVGDRRPRSVAGRHGGRPTRRRRQLRPGRRRRRPTGRTRRAASGSRRAASPRAATDVVVAPADPLAAQTATIVIPAARRRRERREDRRHRRCAAGSGRRAVVVAVPAGRRRRRTRARGSSNLLARERSRPVEHADAHGLGLADDADVLRRHLDGEGDHALAGVGRANDLAEVAWHGGDDGLDEHRRPDGRRRSSAVSRRARRGTARGDRPARARRGRRPTSAPARGSTSGFGCTLSATSSEPASRRTRAYWPTIVLRCDAGTVGMRVVRGDRHDLEVVVADLLAGEHVASNGEHLGAVADPGVDGERSDDRGDDDQRSDEGAHRPLRPHPQSRLRGQLGGGRTGCWRPLRGAARGDAVGATTSSSTSSPCSGASSSTHRDPRPAAEQLGLGDRSDDRHDVAGGEERTEADLPPVAGDRPRRSRHRTRPSGSRSPTAGARTRPSPRARRAASSRRRRSVAGRRATRGRRPGRHRGRRRRGRRRPADPSSGCRAWRRNPTRRRR